MGSYLGHHQRKDVLEWGSGGSTLFFSKYARSWRSIEENATWATEIVGHLQLRNGVASWFHANVTVDLVPAEESVEVSGKDPIDLPYEDYASYVDWPKGSTFDLILIDGSARMACADAV